jgi:chemotaxis protein MotB
MSRPPKGGKVSHERWLVSYADFMTLLFGLFVVMYAFARADQKKQSQVVVAIDSAFKSMGIFPDAKRAPNQGQGTGAGAGAGERNGGGGTEQAAMPMNIVMGEDVLSPAQVRDDMEHIKRELTQTLSNQVASHTVSLQMGHDGLVISLREAGFFDPGSAHPKPATLGTLKEIATSLGKTPYDLRVEGHTDNIPIHNAEFDSNWELSAGRATGIARLFLELHALPADRISAAGFAEYHPVAPNTTAEGRSQNRRVDLVVLPRTRTNLSVPGFPQHNTGEWKKITDD